MYVVPVVSSGGYFVNANAKFTMKTVNSIIIMLKHLSLIAASFKY